MITSIVSFNGTVFAPDYEVGFVAGSEPRLPQAQAEMLARVGAWPVIVALQRKANRHALLIRIVGANRDALRTALFRLFDPEDETPKALVGRNHAGALMYVQCVCEELRVYGDQAHDTAFVVTLAVHDDVRWRAVTASTDTWTITASGQTRTINNGGEDDAYPVITIKPTASKTGGYEYRHFVMVTWRAIEADAQYPVRIGPFDTATPVTAGEMLATGNDLRIFVDGLEVSRSLVAMNDANTYIWFSTSFQRAPALKLTASLASSGTIDSIQLDDAAQMALLPAAGFVRVGNEVFAYTGRDLVNLRLTGISRSVWGTSAAAHSAGDACYWMQHEVTLVYGDAAASAPTAAPGAVPVFTLADSSNTAWKYDVFGDAAYANRPGAWARWGNVTLNGTGGVYTATERTLSATTFSVAGAWLTGSVQGNAFGWFLHNPCGIVNAAWADGKKRAAAVAQFLVHLRYWVRGASWWTNQATLTAPALPNTWEAWSQGAGAAWSPAQALAIAAYFYAQDAEAGTVTVTLNSAETPVVTVGAQQGNYSLAATLTNTATGETLTARFEMDLNEELVIDTAAHTVTYAADGSPQFQAVSMDTTRRRWLRLLPGNNTLRFDDTGTDAVTVTTTFARRYY